MPVKHTRETFIEKAVNTHNGYYTYENTVYVSCYEKVMITCPIHGDFAQTPAAHLAGQGCKDCGKKKQGSRYDTAKFIELSKAANAIEYDYSNTVYTSSSDDVIIVCPIHGAFSKNAARHLAGQGCSKCSGAYSPSTPEWIEKAIVVHGEKYAYTKVIYVNAFIDVIITCKVHGDFEQKPNSHLNGNGCSKCSGKYQPTTEEFIEKAISIQGNKWTYDNVIYVDSSSKVLITCKIHGDFTQTPNAHLSGEGCPKCSPTLKVELEEFLERSMEKHGKRYKYDRIQKIVNTKTKVSIGCSIHGYFLQSPNRHMKGDGCPDCGILERAKEMAHSNESFAASGYIVHSNKYSYEDVVYVNNTTKVSITCPDHGSFNQTPHDHLAGNGCKYCSSNVSKMEIAWIKSLNNPNILQQQSILFDGKKILVDGLDTVTNTVYEFHGDFWHGNPNRYDLDSQNRATKDSFRTLYERTMAKESAIRKAGYTLVVMWELDWEKLNEPAKIAARLARKELRKAIRLEAKEAKLAKDKEKTNEVR